MWHGDMEVTMRPFLTQYPSNLKGHAGQFVFCVARPDRPLENSGKQPKTSLPLTSAKGGKWHWSSAAWLTSVAIDFGVFVAGQEGAGFCLRMIASAFNSCAMGAATTAPFCFGFC